MMDEDEGKSEQEEEDTFAADITFCGAAITEVPLH